MQDPFVLFCFDVFGASVRPHKVSIWASDGSSLRPLKTTTFVVCSLAGVKLETPPDDAPATKATLRVKSRDEVMLALDLRRDTSDAVVPT